MLPPLLKRTCLSPSYSLRKQLLLSFGCSAVITLAIVAIVVCSSVHVAAKWVVETQSQQLLQQKKRHQRFSCFVPYQKQVAFLLLPYI